MILAVDIGTTILKEGLFDSSGNLVKVSHHKVAVSGSQIDPKIWEKAFKEANLTLETDKKDIQCIIISGNGPTLAPSEQGNALLWTHQAEKESKEIFEKTGIKLFPSMFLPKALYIKNNMPDVYKQNRFFLSSPEYLSYKLTSNARTMMPLSGLEKWYWNDEILKELELDILKFPPFIKAGEYLGIVTSQASYDYNLKEGTPVLAGCPDFVTSIIGSGAMHQGQICNRSGTGEGINYCSKVPLKNPSYMCYGHPNTKDWNISVVIPDTGSLIDREKKNMTYSEFFKTEKCQKICTDICNKIKNAIDEVATDKVTEVRLTGGPSKSKAFNQMRANICKLKFTTLESPEAGLSGLYILALSSLEKASITEIADKTVKIKDEYIPEV